MSCFNLFQIISFKGGKYRNWIDKAFRRSTQKLFSSKQGGWLGLHSDNIGD